MPVELSLPAQQMKLATEYDLISIRQETRQMARALGLGLVEQAKIATAISTVARALLTQRCCASFLLQTLALDAQTMLEIVCVLETPPPERGQLEEMCDLTAVRLLVDDVVCSRGAGEAVLRLRMRLGREISQ